MPKIGPSIWSPGGGGDVNKAYVDAQDALKVAKAGDNMSGKLGMPASTAALPAIYFNSANNNGLVLGTGSVILSTGGTNGLSLSNTQVTIPASRVLSASHGRFLNSLRLGIGYDQVPTACALGVSGMAAQSSQPEVVELELFDAPPSNSKLPAAAYINEPGNEEPIIVLSLVLTNPGGGDYGGDLYDATVIRMAPTGGYSSGPSHAAYSSVEWLGQYSTFWDGYCLLPNQPMTMFIQSTTFSSVDPVRLYLPPRYSLYTMSPPADGQIIGAGLTKPMAFDIQLRTMPDNRLLAEIPAGSTGSMSAIYSSNAVDYLPFSLGVI